MGSYWHQHLCYSMKRQQDMPFGKCSQECLERAKAVLEVIGRRLISPWYRRGNFAWQLRRPMVPNGPMPKDTPENDQFSARETAAQPVPSGRFDLETLNKQHNGALRNSHRETRSVGQNILFRSYPSLMLLPRLPGLSSAILTTSGNIRP